MRVPDSIRVARAAPLLAAFVLCLGVFLLPHGLVSITPAPSVPAVEYSTHADAVSDIYPVASIEEKDLAFGTPVNVEHLTAFALVVFFGAVLGLLYGGAPMGRSRGFLLAGRRLPAIVCARPRKTTPALLSVFIL